MFSSIGRVIDNKPVATGFSRSLEAAMVLAKATECSGGRWQAIRFRHGRLTLVAPSPIAAQELVLRKQAALVEINTALGGAVITELTIRS